MPRRKRNKREVDRLIKAVKGNRWGQRNSTMVLLAFRHGLRAAELVLEHALLHVLKLKNGSPASGAHHSQGGASKRCYNVLVKLLASI